MGLILGFIFIVAYAIAIVIATLIGINRDKKPRSGFKYLVLGFVFVTIVTLFFAFFVPLSGLYIWNASILRGIVIIFAPVVIAILVFVFSGNESSNKYKILNTLGMGALYATITMPWITLYIGVHYHDIANYWSFREVCKNAQIQYLVDVPPAKSVLIKTDIFFETRGGNASNKYNLAKLLLNNSTLDFVERTPIKIGDFLGVSRFERITVKGERVLNPKIGDSKRTEFVYRGVNESLAEYVVISKIFELPELHEKGIGGTRIEIRRKLDDELIAFAQYYWDDKTFKNCPENTRDNLFARNFIETALDIAHPESRFKGYAK